MLEEEAKHMESLQEIPGLNPEILAVISALYRSGWRDCWLTEIVSQINEEKSNVH
jgi:hypothetical protein